MSHSVLVSVEMTEAQLCSAFEAAAECGLLLLKDKTDKPVTKARGYGGEQVACCFAFDVPAEKRKNANTHRHYQPHIVRNAKGLFQWGILPEIGYDTCLCELAGPRCRDLLQKTADKHARLVTSEFGYEAVQREVLQDGTIDILFDLSLGQQIADNLMVS